MVELKVLAREGALRPRIDEAARTVRAELVAERERHLAIAHARGQR
jgi:hypothetical protein